MKDCEAILQMVANLYEENGLLKDHVANLQKINKRVDSDANTIYRRLANIEQILSTLEADLETALHEGAWLKEPDIKRLLQLVKKGV